jgi:hypothetical protein
LRQATANYLLGAALLLLHEPDSAPVSMLVHPTHRVAIHDRVALLLRREFRSIQERLETSTTIVDLPEPFQSQLADLIQHGVEPVDETELLNELRTIVRLAHISVVNSAAEQDSISWAASPAHVLVGGNKLDRGFTVEGLTVTYLSRSTTTQADTLAQRARAFGYRRDYLPYCRFFASRSTVDAFAASALTEDAMRLDLKEWVDDGQPLAGWANHVGFILGDNLIPTRRSVAPFLVRTPNRGWHFVANPDLAVNAQAHNEHMLSELGLFDAPRRDFGRLTFRVLDAVPIPEIFRLINEWTMPDHPGWSRTDVTAFLERIARVQPSLRLSVVLLDGVPPGTPRVRSWTPGLGLSNLMQGRDNGYTGASNQYAGDREMFGDASGLQVHWVSPRDLGVAPVHTLALHIGDDILPATEVRRA